MEAPWNSHMSQFNSSLAECSGKVGGGDTFSVADVLEDDVTESVDTEHKVTTEAVVVEGADDTGAVKVEPGADTETVDKTLAVEAEAAVLARAAWCLTARWQFFSLSAGPRCRGRRGREGGGAGGAAAGPGGREWGASGLPIVQLNSTVVTPLLVERLREAIPPRVQTEINSVTDAVKNW